MIKKYCCFLPVLLFVCVVFLLFAASANAEVEIEKEHRVSNYTDLGVCAWSAIETSGRAIGLVSLFGLADKRHKQASEWVTETRIEQTRQPYGWRQVEKRVQRKDNGGTTARIKAQLDALGVKYTMQYEGVYDRKILYSGTKDDAGGVVIGIYNYVHNKPVGIDKERYFRFSEPPAGSKDTSYHAVLLIHIDDEVVRFIDPNDTRRPWAASRKWFDRSWDGSGLVLSGRLLSKRSSPGGGGVPPVMLTPGVSGKLTLPPGVTPLAGVPELKKK